MLVALGVMAFGLAEQLEAPGGTGLRTAGPPEQHVPDRLPRDVPRTGPEQVAFGVHLDWTADTPSDYRGRLHASPVYHGAFIDLPFEEDELAALDAQAAATLAADSALLLTLEPQGGLGTVTDDVLRDVTVWLTSWNDRGLPVLVRFAHEMNGSWYAWGQRPEAYVATFRRASRAVRAAPTSEIMWAPNEGGGYPFPGGVSNAEPGDADLERLDTDGDGELTQADDPYAPYYPGDEYVDWVGLTIYHFGDGWPWGDNVLPEPEKFVDKLGGTYDGTEGDQTAVPDFHADYAAGRDLPLMITETSALYNTDRPSDVDDLDIKTAWLEQVLADDLIDVFPALEAIMWFEMAKAETEIDDELISWAVSYQPETLDALQQRLPAWLRFRENGLAEHAATSSQRLS